MTTGIGIWGRDSSTTATRDDALKPVPDSLERAATTACAGVASVVA